MMTILRWSVLALLAWIPLASTANPDINLAGTWRFQLDPADEGVTGRWFGRTLPERLRLPGSLQLQGFGNLPTRHSDWTSGIGASLLDDPRFQRYIQAERFMCPFWLTPTRHYVGAAWYQRDVEIPPDWAQRRIVLHLERPHWQTMLWIDDRKVGVRDGLGVPHAYDLTEHLAPGSHRLTLRVDNRMIVPVGADAHSISDQTQGNWNGIVGELKLVSTPRVWIDDVQVFPDTARREVRLQVALGNHTGAAGSATLTARAKTVSAVSEHAAAAKSWPVEWSANGNKLEFVYPLGEGALLWDEFQPNVYELSLELADGATALDTARTAFGLRELGIAGTQFTINGRRIFLRGTLECCVFPLTGYPATDVASWKRIMRVCRAHGLNHLRFHSWCPPEAAFIAADEVGMYLQAECSAWAVFGEGTEVDTWVEREAERMLTAYGNHPSFMLMAASNEPHGTNRGTVLEPLVRAWTARDPRRFYTCGAGWPHLPANQFHINQEARLQRFGPLKLSARPQTAADYRTLIADNEIPVVTHEIGQWCVYPNIAERLKYTGFLEARNLEIFRDLLDRAGMLDQAADFLLASGKFQTLLYKQEIEAALRTPGQAGIQLLALQDFPGQGTAPVGVLDALWDPKGYVSAAEYRQFCNHTVPLARLPRFVWTGDETLEIGVDVACYGPADLPEAVVEWRLTDPAGRPYAQGALPATDVRTGTVNPIGNVRIPLVDLPAPSQAVFSLVIAGTPVHNAWPVWVYPSEVVDPEPTDVTVTADLEDALAALANGGRVLLVPPPYTVRGNTLGTFRPIFWNRITFPSQTEHTLGVLCQADHPALADFPTSFHSDWQWWELFEHSKPMVLDGLPGALRPIVQPIDDWNDCRRLGLLFEARVGAGRLLVCSMDVQRNLARRPVARQLRHSLLSYLAGDRVAPAVELAPDQVRRLFKKPSAVQRLGATVSADSHEPLHEPQQALDDNPQTIWHTAWLPSPAPMPHHLVLDLQQPVKVYGLTYLPRQDQGNGRIAEFEIVVSADGENWSQPVAAGTWPDGSQRQTVRFDEPRSARYVKLIARSEVYGQPYASAAEIGVLLEP